MNNEFLNISFLSLFFYFFISTFIDFYLYKILIFHYIDFLFHCDFIFLVYLFTDLIF